jgi:hypothetical protein
MKPRILVLYYTQTGQVQRILESIVAGMDGNADIEAAEIEPVTPYPFPWPSGSFYDILPTVMAHSTVPLKPLSTACTGKDYDLVILGYQPWFLNPSLPVISFLKSEQAQLLKNKPVVTVTGCTKMWLHAQEEVKKYLTGLNAHLVGNIVLKDCTPNPVSFITSARWMYKGKKEAGHILPDAGVANDDIYEARRFGKPICRHLIQNNLIDLQRELLALGAVHLSPAMIIAEQNMLKNYRAGAKYIQGKEGLQREKRVKRFKNMMAPYYALWPLMVITSFVKLILRGPSLLKDKEYFRQLKYQEGKFP